MCKRVGQDLDRDLTTEIRVGGAIHFAHAACAERTDNLVWADAGAGDERHLVRRHEPLQFLGPVLHDDEARGRSGLVRAITSLDHEKPLAVR